YDPEIIKYKDNLIEYEKFSVLVCDYIINESCFSDRERIESCLIIIKYIFSEINNFSVTFLEKCFDYWGNMSSYFTNSLDLKSLLSKPFNDFDNDKFRNYLEYSGEKNLSFNINGDNKDQLTFNLIHMTVNRHNFNPLEERSIYKYLIGELKKYDR
ncbi:TPA: hypothetical protein RJQ37_002367, partial [Staphylococcus pseudintermedius]|nr:hypothetical protein [Staphylococcus pseudintermedius]